MKEFFVKNEQLIREIIRFLIVGVIATVSDYITYNLFFYYVIPSDFRWWIIDLIFLSKTAGFVIGVTVNYILSVFIVFRNVEDKTKSRSPLGFVIFVLLGLVGLLLSLGITYLGNVIYSLDKSFWWNSAVFVIATIIVLIYNYLSRKLLLFKNKKAEPDVLDK